MKRNLVFVLFALVSVVGFSQVSWNAKVGMNISNFTGDFDMNAKVGFKIGGAWSMDLMKSGRCNPLCLYLPKVPRRTN